ncbi:ketopantoate reductase family protein [Aliiglaciecola lipolytica]|uniref:ketopantoate reductase family protein n=1 Tax=Aliiglaciecola lipolytica TaxID=477689 RepID=UPI001C09850C|nr:2-dehydropantoate 2-reductase [Aliiglaciecola lipolytica]MBU2879941.1 2-dehydropantoate 2-reductase [Aliiglaciecola lipolytica]
MLTIVGNGAIGNLLALQCHHLQFDYRIVVRNQSPSEIRCQTVHQQEILRPVYQRSSDTIEQGLFILPLKAYQIIPAIGQFKSQLSAEVPLVLLHNGMVDHAQILELLPNNPILVATTSYGAFKPQYDGLNVTGIGATQAGWLRNSDDNLGYQQVFEKLLPPCSWHKDILQILWRKLAVNSVINPLTAIHNVANGELAKQPYRSTIMGVTKEISTLMNAVNLAVTQQELFANCMAIIEKTAGNYSSMHQDVQYKRKTEIENISGYVVSQGKQLSIPVPFNNELFEQVKKIETYYL